MSDHDGNEKAARARHLEAGPEDIRQVLEIDGNTAKVLHADGTVDFMDTKALGGELDTMPAGYYRSPQFIGTVLVSFLRNDI